MSGRPARTLQELASLVAGWAATERRLFEVVGSWVRLVDDPALKVVLARHSRHHGWRASVLAEVVPTASGLDASGTVAAAVAALGGPEDLDRLYGSVLPALADGYEAFVGTAAPAEAAVARLARLVAVDARDDLASRP